MKRIFSFLMLSISGTALYAQQFRPMSSTQIYDKVQQLNVLGTVMYMAAHPDDENTRLISYLVHHDHIRTIYLSLTRGDGGQNILGNEQGSTLPTNCWRRERSMAPSNYLPMLSISVIPNRPRRPLNSGAANN